MGFVTILPQVIPTWNWSGTTGKIRVFASNPFFEEITGTYVPAGRTTNINSCCLVEDCTIDGTDFSIPSVQLATTLDSTTPQATYTAILYDENDVPRYTLLSQFILSSEYFQTDVENAVQVTGAGSSLVVGYYTARGVHNNRNFYNLVTRADDYTEWSIYWTGTEWRNYDTTLEYTGTSADYPWEATWSATGGDTPVGDYAQVTLYCSATWEQVTLANQAFATTGPPFSWDGPFWNVPQTQEYINNLIGDGTTPYANVGIVGKTALDTAPVLSTMPIAVATNSPRLQRDLYADYDNDLPTAFADIGSANVTLLVSRPTILSSNVTFDSNVVFEFIDRGKVTVNAGRTLTIGAMLNPGEYQQCFSLAHASTSHVYFAQGAVPQINIAWFVGPPSADITSAMNNATASCTAVGGGWIYIPAGQWSSSGGHVCTKGTYIVGVGCGQSTSDFYYTQLTLTASDTYLFKFGESSRWCGVDQIALKGTRGPLTTSCALLYEGDAGIDGTAFHQINSVSMESFHWGIKINALDASFAFQCVDVAISHHSSFLGCDYTVYSNTPNTNITNNAFIQVNFDITNNIPQYAGDFDRCGLLNVTGEHAGQSLTGTTGGAAHYGDYQTETQLIKPTDVISGSGTAIATVHAARMYGDGTTWAGITFTASSATDILTAAGHGYYTGLIVQVSTTGTLPGNLFELTDYYVIVINANTFYLATTLGNALAGTYIDLTTNGTGTNTVTPQVYALGSPVNVNIALTVGASTTFTAVAATDILTATANGFSLAQAVTLSTTGSLPNPLIAATPYYVIPIDADTFYLATSAANASAGTHINLTTDGTPTNTVTIGVDANSIANTVRNALMANPQIGGAFHCGYAYGTPNEMRLVALDTGTRQVTTAVLAGTISTGNITWTITKAGMTGSPLAITAPVLTGDSLATAATKSAFALNSNSNFAAMIYAEAIASNGTIQFTCKDAANNDPTFNAAFTGAGTTPDATSEATIVGFAPNDTTANFALDPNGVPGLTRDATYCTPTSVRTPGAENKLAMGYRFNGQHSPVVFSNPCTDEGIENFIINNSDETESYIGISGCDVQGTVRLNKKCTLEVTGRMTDRGVRDGGSDLATYFGGASVMGSPVVPLYTNFHLSTGNTLMLLNGRRFHNIVNIAGDNRDGALIGWEVDPMNRRVRSGYTLQISSTEDSRNYANGRPPAAFMSDDAYNDPYSLGVGTSLSNGEPTYLYEMGRYGEGQLKFQGPQERPFCGYEFDGPLLATSFVGIASDVTFFAGGNNQGFAFYYDRDVIRISLSGDFTITGILAPTYANGSYFRDGWSGWLANVDTGHLLTFTNQDASSTDVNRIITPNGANYHLEPNQLVRIYYDLTTQRWRLGANATDGVERLLQTTNSVNLNTATATTLYTVPSGRSCIVTKFIIRNASTSLTLASVSFGYNSTSFNDVVPNQTYTELTGSTLYTPIMADMGAKVGAATDVLKIKANTLQGSAATCSIDVFGILL